VIAFSDSGVEIKSFLYVYGALLIFSGYWLVMSIKYLYDRYRNGIYKKNLFFWIAQPAIFVLPLCLAYFNVYSYARFVISEPYLLSYVQKVRNGEVDLNFEFNHPKRVVGLYGIFLTELLPDGTVLFLTSSHFLDKAGFVFTNQKRPAIRGEDSYVHIKGNWWYWRHSW
jgi:hypothetical protein